MTEQDPAEQVEAGLRAFLSQLRPDAVPLGWVLVYQTTQRSESSDDGVGYTLGYLTADDADPARTVGLATWAARAIPTDLTS